MRHRRAIQRLLAASTLATAASFAHAANSQFVKVGASGRILYTPDDTGDRVMDFSSSGYKGGGVPLPNYTSVVTPDRVLTLNVLPSGADNLAQIQNAINQVASLSLNSNGFRGVVQLNAGTWAISNTININSSGIILRGVGSGASTANNTILAYTGTGTIDMVHVDSSSSRSTNTKHQIVDKVVPVGATSFTVDSTTSYAVGDTILIHRPSPQSWIDDIEMNTIGTWTPGSRDVNTERKITYIDQARKRIFLDAPIVNAIEKKYVDTNGEAGSVSKYTFARTTNVGVENLRGDGQAVLTTPDSELHANSFVVMQDTGDSWVRNVTGEHLVYATVEAGTNARNITVDGATSVNPVSQITGGRRYPFNIEGSFVLMKNLSSDEGRHEFINNSPSRGPNVFLDAVATNGHADSGTHQRYSTGTLWDNVTTNTDINVQNRYTSGTGHGWSGANMVIWNSNAGDFYVQQTLTAQNWLIGSTGTVRSTSQFGPGVWPAYYDANNAGSKVTLNGETSLYRAQLAERLGHADEQRREYWLGDFDSYENDGAADNAPVDATWQSQVNAFKPGTSKVGFDTSLSASNISVPMTFTVDLGGTGGATRPTRVTSATLTLAVHANNASAANDSIWIESTGNAIPFSSLGTLPHFGNSDIVTLEFLASNPNLGLTFLNDGMLNVLVSDNHTVDWADFNFTLGSSKVIAWTGTTNGTWDINTATNWTDGSVSEKFFQGDDVTFGDGPTNRTITLNTTVFPASVTFNNAGANAYTITGPGAIGGGASLVKNGSATLNLVTDNAYAGQTIINAGTVIVGANGTVGTLGQGNVTNNATLAFNRSDAVTLSNNISGTGALRHIGSGTTTLSGSNGYSGQTFVTNGTLRVTNSNALGTATVTIANTGALDIGGNLTANQLNFGSKFFVISGDGPTGGGGAGQGAIVNFSGVNQQNAFQKITLAGNASVGGDSRFDLRNGTPVLDLAGFTLTKRGTNQFTLVGATMTNGNVNVVGGTFSIETSSTVAGTGTITYGPGTVAQFYKPTGTISRPMVSNGATFYDAAQTNAATIASNVNLQSSSVFNMSATAGYTFTGVISGGGALTKNGAGKLVLNGDNTYAGGTSVNTGTLEVAPSGAVGTGGLFVAGAGTVNVRAGRSNALQVAALTITAPGVIDLNDNDMIVGSSTPTSSVIGYVSLARNGGAWTGSGLTSTAARNNASHATTLGVLVGAEYTAESGGLTNFSGRAFAPGDTLVKYTWYGDSNLDGRVTFDDYVNVDVGFGSALSGWLNGDFNYDGLVNFDDYVLIDIAFNAQNGTLSRAIDWISGDDRSGSGRAATGVGTVIEHFEQFGAAYGQAFLAAVPEPTCAATVLSAGAASLLGRGRSRRRRAIIGAC